ncbi:MAG TPA: M20 family metallopeptidase [Planctomycetota bacterium]|nr:M20 family metallopeptidase [Planctomycetota bacterium]
MAQLEVVRTAGTEAADAPAWTELLAHEYDDLVRIRHHLHEHPELSWEERETSALVQRELKACGIEVRAGMAKGTGVVGILRGEAPGADSREARAVALRADMDALPITETSEVPWCSKTPGKMHACGHDGHTTTLLGAARVLSKHRERLKGTVVFCFQPAEESGGGGRYMVEEGALDNPRCQAAFAIHGQPTYDVGVIAIKPGVCNAASDGLSIVIRGRGGHGAAPHLCVDPIVAGARVIEALQSIVSREVPAVDSAVISICTARGGTARNVIPETFELGGTIRTLTPEMRTRVHEAVRRVVEGTCAAAGAECRVEVTSGYPVVVNDEALARFALQVARDTVGTEKTVEMKNPGMGGEDFAYYGQRVPSTLFRVGVATRANYPGLHHPSFDFSDAAIVPGAAMFCALAERFLATGLP